MVLYIIISLLIGFAFGFAVCSLCRIAAISDRRAGTHADGDTGTMRTGTGESN